MTLLKLTLASLLLGGCFARPSDSYACQTSAECDPGRTCEENFCVIGAGSDDAGTDGTSANDCEKTKTK